jgi:hypothetical protein
MTMRCKLLCSAAILALAGVTLLAQVQPPQVLPVPIPGGDLIAPFGLFNQFFPGEGLAFDGLNADPHGITNFGGVIAMGYTNGLATDNAGKTYQVITDIRVYRGKYIGAQATFGGGGTTSAKAHGTFVEI